MSPSALSSSRNPSLGQCLSKCVLSPVCLLAFRHLQQGHGCDQSESHTSGAVPSVLLQYTVPLLLSTLVPVLVAVSTLKLPGKNNERVKKKIETESEGQAEEPFSGWRKSLLDLCDVFIYTLVMPHPFAPLVHFLCFKLSGQEHLLTSSIPCPMGISQALRALGTLLFRHACS